MSDIKKGEKGWTPSSTAEAAKVVAAYVLFGGLWILLSDRFLLSLSPDEAFYHSFQTYKGWFYVCATAALLYFLITRSMEKTRRLEEERRQGELKLLRSQRLELAGRLAGGIAHDFNNILTAIMGLSQMTARSMPENDPRRADIEDIVGFSEKASALTRQLLTFSRKQIAAPRPLDPAGIVNGVKNMLARAAGETIKLRIDCAGDAGTMSADPGQVEQALMNLAVNARDAMPGGGTLEVSARRKELPAETADAAGTPLKPGAYVALEVRDEGHGMDDATRARIFEPFFTTKPEGKGTGLGLSVVKNIMDEAGGGILLESAPGGSRFTLLFPAIAAVPAPAEGPLAAPARPGDGETVLLVDDEPEVLKVVARILRGAGYRVLSAGTYEEALRLALAHDGRIDLLISDTILPDRPGPDLADAIAGLRPEAAALFISGHADEALLKTRVTDKGRPLLLKPFPAETLLSKVREVLGRKVA
jgi:signal transduction histidine kinase